MHYLTDMDIVYILVGMLLHSGYLLALIDL